MIEALSFIPIVGQATNFFNSVSEWNKYKIDKIIPQIMAIAKPINIDEDRQNKIAYALKKVFSENDTKISEYASVKRKEFEKLIYDKYNECSILEDDSSEIKAYIKEIIDVILNNIDMIETSESYGKTALKNTANHEERISALEEDKQQKNNKICDDNEIFAQKYNDVLFLDKGRNPKIFLSGVYVDPSIKGYDISLDEQLRAWEKKPNEYSTFYNDADARVLLLYGKAGIGKSSLVAKLISKNFFKNQAHAVILNKKTDKIDHNNPWGSIKQIYGCDDDICYNNKVLILDGFDEVCVLKNKDFQGHVFLEKLTTMIPDNIFVKILITSREYNGYFEKVREITGSIIIRHIEWEKDQLFQWCKNYLRCRKKDTKIKQWTTDFKEKFETLEENLQDAFHSPIILYICCHENIKIFKLDSITDVYYQAFHKIVRRDYITSGRLAELNKTDEEMATLLWQYTKEIAFQIFLNSNEISIANADMIKKAKSFVDLENSEFDSKILDILPAVFHFTSEKGDGAVEFAHKTVVEYFIAVKIYEDYFKELDREKDIDEVWHSIYESFGYKFIPSDIFKNVFNMINSPDLGIKGKFDKQAFFEKFESGMKQEKLMKCAANCDEKYIKCINYDTDLPLELVGQSKNERIDEAFRNLTWFLNGLDYRNSSFTLLFKYLKPFLHIEGLNLSNLIFNSFLYSEDGLLFEGHDYFVDSSIEILRYINDNKIKFKTIRNDFRLCSEPVEIIFPVWDYKNLSSCYFQNTYMEYMHINNANLSECHFENAHLHGATLKKSNISHSYLLNSDLSDTNLENVDFEYTNLTNANLANADLNGANLRNVDFRGSYLSHADLSYADLYDANLSYADLNGAHLNSVKLSNANLSNADLIDADLSKADLRYVDFNGAVLSYANLNDANLLVANLSSADLNSAKFIYADLSGADLRSADLRNADLRGANLENVKFEKTHYNFKTIFPEGFEINHDKMIFVDEKIY